MSLVFFYPQFKKLTGAERLILKLADYTARRSPGEEVIVLTHRFAAECRPALGEGVRLVETGWPLELTGNHYIDAAVEYALGPALSLRIPKEGLGGVIFFGPPSVPAMWFARRILFPLTRRRPPILYFCFEPPRFVYSDTGDVAGRVGRLGRLVVVLAFVYRFLDRRLVRSADRVLSNSPYGARRIRNAYGRRATVIEHGVDFSPPAASDVEHLRLRYALEGRPVVITVNHLHPRKRIDLFLRAVAESRKSSPSVAALVVGGGPEREALEDLAAQMGLRPGVDAVFTGAVPEATLPAHYALADVYVHTGREESFGLSVIEALYSGVPVVSVNEGGPCDTVHDGWSGYLVPADAHALGEKIAGLVSDGSRRDEMGAHGADFVRRHFRWERGAETLLNVLGMVSRQLAAWRGVRVPRLRASR